MREDDDIACFQGHSAAAFFIPTVTLSFSDQVEDEDMFGTGWPIGRHGA